VDGVPHFVGHQRSTHRSRGLIGWRCFISSILGSHHCSFNSTAINRALRAAINRALRACSYGCCSPCSSDRNEYCLRACRRPCPCTARYDPRNTPLDARESHLSHWKRRVPPEAVGHPLTPTQRALSNRLPRGRHASTRPSAWQKRQSQVQIEPGCGGSCLNNVIGRMVSIARA
jgi:hypothetical protein